MSKLTVVIDRLNDKILLPKRATDGSSAYDIYAPENSLLMCGEIRLIKLGFKVQIPVGWEIEIVPRSGLALKEGIIIVNSPGTIDSDYRGEVGLIIHKLVTMNSNPSQFFKIEAGSRLAQMKIKPVYSIVWVDGSVTPTIRGEGGFGSTGI